MLGKLIKYDMKSLNRFLPVMHFFVLLSALLIRLFITGRIQPSLSGSQLDFLLIITFHYNNMLSGSLAGSPLVLIG